MKPLQNTASGFSFAGGRRFKYPVQYAKHRLVINTIVISVVASLLVALVIWWQFTHLKIHRVFYRITRVLPLPVAVVDDRTVPYSDYSGKDSSHKSIIWSSNKASISTVKRIRLN